MHRKGNKLFQPPSPIPWAFIALLCVFIRTEATPANKAAFARHYDAFLDQRLNSCTTCHLPNPNKSPESLEDFPHNSFGARLRALARELAAAGRPKDIASRLALLAGEDSDADGVANETELLLGRSPGDKQDQSSEKELAKLSARQQEFAHFLKSYRWEPFRTPARPLPPTVKNHEWVRNPIDQFIAAEHPARRLTPRPEASREILLRRVYLDLIGLAPTRAEVEQFVASQSPTAYEEVVKQLLNDPRYGQRWARHWMDIWRYSDWAGWTDGNQIRDSQPHIWRWREWIVESLNEDKSYARMLTEMLAADELAPGDTKAVRATGFLARNYKMLSREQWLDDTLKHTSQAFMGITVGCAKCHDHMTDPISQVDYYRLRAVFEPHQVRIDRVPGQPDVALNGLTRVYDVDTNPPTYLFFRGDEKRPQTNFVLTPEVPAIFHTSLDMERVSLPGSVALPDKREFVIRDLVAAREKALAEATSALAETNSADRTERELIASLAEAELQSLLALLAAEKLEDLGERGASWEAAAKNANTSQRKLAWLEARLKLHRTGVAKVNANTRVSETGAALEDAMLVSGTDAAEKVQAKRRAAEKAQKELEDAVRKFTEADKAFASAETAYRSAAGTSYKPRPTKTYPDTSTGRRLAFARWLAAPQNPLTARVAVNHLWARHFGRGLVPNVANFGPGGKPPSHPALLDWLAVEFMDNGWSMKHLHRLIVTSGTYRMSSSSDEQNAAADPDNLWFWRMNSRTMEGELVRDNVLYVTGNLDPSMGGAEIDAKLALTSKRRSLYLRCAQEKQAEFLQIFDGPSVVECYERKPTVMPQQALALANSELAIAQARILAASLSQKASADRAFVESAFWTVLSRAPLSSELELSQKFLYEQSAGSEADSAPSHEWARQNLILVLFNHNDFVTIR